MSNEEVNVKVNPFVLLASVFDLLSAKWARGPIPAPYDGGSSDTDVAVFALQGI